MEFGCFYILCYIYNNKNYTTITGGNYNIVYFFFFLSILITVILVFLFYLIFIIYIIYIYI